jgi:methyl-accepting chemotaxis protein
MKIEMKVMWAMILMAVIVLIIGLVGIFGMSQINKSRDEIAKVTLPSIIAPEIINEAQTAIQRGERTFSLLRGVLIGAIVLSILLAVAIGILIRRNVVHIIGGLMDEAGKLVKAAIRGNLAMRGDPEKVNFEFRDIVKDVNEILDAVIGPLNIASEYVDRISKGENPQIITGNYNGDFNLIKNNLNACIEATAQQGNAAQKMAAGDLSVRIRVRSEQDIIAISMNNVIASLNGLRNEMQRLTKASQEGMLSERGRPEQFQGAYAEVVQGVNETLDAILLPIGEGNRILRLIRGGNLREKVEIVCKGDHERMKDAINGLHAWLSELVAYVTKIAYGDLTATMPKASEEDQIHERLVLMKDNLHALVADATMLAKAAVDGKFSTRADTEKHQGDFRKLVSGVNEILDAVIRPLNLAAEYMDRISKGDIPKKISDTDKSDFDEIFWEMVAQNKPFFK